ncbi:hypothetical protein MPSEU_000395800 [Mayamaea pseudoterrestris]|nr:hypothetical protein MPSEU_000395800 [Mayamaea pseudoterrestris]
MDSYKNENGIGLPASLVRQLQAGAFESLCQHLQERSDQVSNMDLMTLSGFCRNCLAKWMVLEARKLVDDAASEASLVSDDSIHAKHPYADQLNQFGYDQAAQIVYGMQYGDWKKQHQQKATDEQLERYQSSRSLWAKHNEELLPTRVNAEAPTSAQAEAAAESSAVSNEGHGSSEKNIALSSNVCCETFPTPSQGHRISVSHDDNARSINRSIPPYAPPSISADCYKWKHAQIRVSILTVSDRAFHNEYENGDLSGPAVEESVKELLGNARVSTRKAIVPDDMEAIQSRLMDWCDGEDASATPHLILTTGGTGLSARDVTPEATRKILYQEASGLMGFVSMECSRQQPLASLSRGTAGLRGTTFVANLPGNPKAAHEILTILLPLLAHGLEL